MVAFRVLLVLMACGIAAYTVVVGMHHGWNLLPVFVGSIIEVSWSGQFNLDFMMFLALAALWVAWRNRFAPVGLAYGAATLFLGMTFFAPYLLWLSLRPGASVEEILIGKNRLG